MPSSFQSLLVALGIALCNFQCLFGQGNWPRPNNLQVFQPFDSETGVSDIARRTSYNLEVGAQLQSAITGPFNLSNTSYTFLHKDTEDYQDRICCLRHTKSITSFTFSQFVYFSSKDSENIRPILLTFDYPNLHVQVFFKQPNLLAIEVRATPLVEYPIITMNKWQFIALTYDSSSETLNTYHGEGVRYTKPAKIPATSTNPEINIGTYNDNLGNTKPPRITDAYACFMYYDAALASYEIAQLRDVCKTKGQGELKDYVPKPTSLAAFWPLDQVANLTDVAFLHAPTATKSPRLAATSAGPFGKLGTSYSVTVNNDWIAQYSNARIPSSFTFSFYVYTVGSKASTLFSFQVDGTEALSINFVPPNFLQLQGDSTNTFLPAALPLVKPNAWNFFALAYNFATKVLDVYGGDNVTLLVTMPNVGVTQQLNTTFYIGHTMQTTDALACVMIYHTRLTRCEIADLPRVCRENWAGYYNPGLYDCRSQRNIWPRPSSAVGFWPLDFDSSTGDIIYQRVSVGGSGYADCKILGPFGAHCTSMSSPTPQTESIAEFANVPLSLKFTLSFYYRAGSEKLSSILSFDPAFSIYYLGNNKIGLNTQIRRIEPILETSACSTWCFVAITYDKASRHLEAFNNSGAVRTRIDNIDIPARPGNTLYLGRSSSPVDPAHSMTENSSIACVMFYNTVLLPSEIRELPFVCRTKGRATLTGTVISDNAELTYVDILAMPPVSSFNGRTNAKLSYYPSEIVSSWDSTYDGSLKTGILTQPTESNGLGSIQPLVMGITSKSWRIELKFTCALPTTDNGELWSKFAIIMTASTSLAEHIRTFNRSGKFYANKGVPALVVGQYLTVAKNNAARQFLAVGNKSHVLQQLDTRSDNATLHPHCRFSYADSASGIKMVLQTIDNRLTVAFYSKLQTLPAVCIDNVDVSSLEPLISAKRLSFALVASQWESSSEKANHTILVKELNLFEITPTQTPNLTKKDAESITVDAMSIPAWANNKTPRLELCQSFLDSATFGNAWNSTSSALKIDPTSFSIHLLDPTDSPTGKTVSTKMPIPNTALDWRIEFKFSVIPSEVISGTAWWFNIAITDTPSLPITYTYSGESLVKFRGFGLSQSVQDRRNMRYFLASIVENSVTDLQDIVDNRCDLDVNDVTNGTLIVMQSIYEQISVSLMRPGRSFPTSCISNRDFPGMNSLIESGSARIALSVPQLLQPSKSTPTIKISELHFFNLAAKATPESACQMTTTVSTASTTGRTRYSTGKTTVVPVAVTSSPVKLTTTGPTQSSTGSSKAVAKNGRSITVLAQIKDFYPTLGDESSLREFTIANLMKECSDFAPYRTAPPNNGEPTTLESAFQVERLVEFSEAEESVSLFAEIFFHWNVTTCPMDSTLKFVAKSEPQRLYMANPDEVWLPRVIFPSSSSDIFMKGGQFGEDSVATFRNGTENLTLDFYYSRPGIFSSQCKVNLENFPFDRQTCGFTFALQHSSQQVQFENLQIMPIPLRMESTQWHLDSSTSSLFEMKLQGKQVHGVTITMNLSRLSGYYLLNHVLPSCMLSILEVGTFFLEIDSPERPSLSVTLLLSLVYENAIVLKDIPHIGKPILLRDYVLELSCLSALITLYQMTVYFIIESKFFKLRFARWIDIAVCVAFFAGCLALHITVWSAKS